MPRRAAGEAHARFLRGSPARAIRPPRPDAVTILTLRFSLGSSGQLLSRLHLLPLDACNSSSPSITSRREGVGRERRFTSEAGHLVALVAGLELNTARFDPPTLRLT